MRISWPSELGVHPSQSHASIEEVYDYSLRDFHCSAFVSDHILQSFALFSFSSTHFSFSLHFYQHYRRAKYQLFLTRLENSFILLRDPYQSRKSIS